jgi:hypothetical protein
MHKPQNFDGMVDAVVFHSTAGGVFQARDTFRKSSFDV